MSSTTVPAAGSGGASGFLAFLFGRGPLDRLADLPAWIAALVLLVPRYFLAAPFWAAGTQRLNSWPSQTFLFEQVHPLPLLDPLTAAYVTTAAELALPVLLILGLLGRWAGLGLAVMAATIYFVVGGSFAIPSEQFPWMAMGLLIFILGPGRLSLDYAIRRFVLRD
ncbi:MAG: DoxX family membrane protein [Azospirillaceae bacterium]